MSRTPPGVWDAVAAYRNRLDEGRSQSRPDVGEPTSADPSPALVGTPLCSTCNGYGWTVSIDGARPYLNTVVPCPDCQGAA